MAINNIEPSPVDNERNLLYKLLRGFYNGTFSSGGGGGGGGGAVTIADGSDVAEGAKADTAATNNTGSWSVVSMLKGIYGKLSGVLSVQATDGNLVTVGAKADASYSSGDGTLVSILKGIYNTLNGTPLVNIGSPTLGGISSAITAGGRTTLLKDTTAVSTSPAYSAGDAVGGKRTISAALFSSIGARYTGILESVTILDRANQKAAMTLFIFDADPAAATITDNAAFVFSTDDLKVIAQVNIMAADYVTTNGKAIAQKTGLGVALKSNATGDLYAALVTTGTPTFVATTDVQLEYGFLSD